MIWQNPWAWLGLAAIAIPVLIHLLGRDKAPRQLFPSLRFIEIAELPPTRRTRLHDLLLLATRVAIVAVAAAALAQPLLLLASRRAAIDSQLARAIIVDTSASMLRLSGNGGRALDSARSEAKRLAGDARTSIVIETSAPSTAINGAVRWLESQPSHREIAVISDFQTGSIDSASIAEIPSPIGVRAVPIPTATVSDVRQLSLARNAIIAARVDVATNATNATTVAWTLGRTDSVGRAEPRIAIDAADNATAEVIASAAKTLGVASPIDTASLVSVIFPGAPDRDALMKRGTRVSSARLIDVVTKLSADSLLGPVALKAGGDGRTIAEDTVGGMHRLLVFSYDSVASVRGATLVAAVRRALSVAPPVEELDSSTIPSSVIVSWQRAPSVTPTRENTDSGNGPSDARWLWLVVLALLGAEAWLRRERAASAIRVEERKHDRAA